MEDIYIVTNRDYKALAKEQLPDLPEENILCEPVGRNTAPCVGLAAMHINKKYDDALMIVLPSDHLIKYNSMFVDVLKDACQVAEKGSNLTTIGITPNYPETGYGYIKFDPDQSVGRAYGVECFVEKPNLKKASKGIISLGKVRSTVAVPTMNEEITISGNRIYIVFESVSFYSAEQRVDRVCALPVSYVTKLTKK